MTIEVGTDSTPRLTMYTTPWCGYCVRLKKLLTRAEILYQEIDIEQDPNAAELVMSVNGGNRTVPTVVLDTGQAMTNPSLKDIQQALNVIPA